MPPKSKRFAPAQVHSTGELAGLQRAMWRVISRPLTPGNRMQPRWTDGRPTSAVTAQIAAAIALLQAAPIRRKNLANLDLAKHLISRGKRLYLLAAAIRWGGARAEAALRRNIERLGWVVVALVVVGVVVYLLWR